MQATYQTFSFGSPFEAALWFGGKLNVSVETSQGRFWANLVNKLPTKQKQGVNNDAGDDRPWRGARMMDWPHVKAMWSRKGLLTSLAKNHGHPGAKCNGVVRGGNWFKRIPTPSLCCPNSLDVRNDRDTLLWFEGFWTPCTTGCNLTLFHNT